MTTLINVIQQVKRIFSYQKLSSSTTGSNLRNLSPETSFFVFFYPLKSVYSINIMLVNNIISWNQSWSKRKQVESTWNHFVSEVCSSSIWQMEDSLLAEISWFEIWVGDVVWGYEWGGLTHPLPCDQLSPSFFPKSWKLFWTILDYTSHCYKGSWADFLCIHY